MEFLNIEARKWGSENLSSSSPALVVFTPTSASSRLLLTFGGRVEQEQDAAGFFQKIIASKMQPSTHGQRARRCGSLSADTGAAGRYPHGGSRPTSSHSEVKSLDISGSFGWAMNGLGHGPRALCVTLDIEG